MQSYLQHNRFGVPTRRPSPTETARGIRYSEEGHRVSWIMEDVDVHVGARAGSQSGELEPQKQSPCHQQSHLGLATSMPIPALQKMDHRVILNHRAGLLPSGCLQ